MFLNHLDDFDLNEKMKTLAGQERKLTQEIISHIAEVDRRKLFLSKAYPSLFEYLVREIGYSAGAAQRRIDATRLSQRVPEVNSQIESGAIHLSQISKMQKICRQIKKESGENVQASLQKAVLKKLENQNSEQTDIILAQEFDIKIQTFEKKVVQKDESVRIELTFTREEMALIKQAQDLLSNKTGGALKATILEATKRTIKSFHPKGPKATATVAVSAQDADRATSKSITHRFNASASKSKPGASESILGASESKPIDAKLKSVTLKLKKAVLHRDRFCQFTDAATGKVCGATRFLEVDHIQPRFTNGENALSNLQALCKNHNKYRYQEGLF